ncbi:tRNA (adenosine(37)-N6)-dimethylallyltransferase MiaA [Fundicoccus culcitae]|uniref:tRNA dimethylallyltransferase n=1 Tax=Fundicoccus culcitae TaxID=2969821 RepID=A0ABY5P6A5_9LACT|nr:tRNA (adenosine(37)-N6)-dimethylallyltransferase MiaA [Fundicoccus culcitae]UUX34257.1 tRNA (adenosine(37)-N6)-dimethylallyltransferase MiaA [Fundicoccus culcitae]
MAHKIPLIVIGGPTAVGKTALSIELAKHFDGEIINGDSIQIYKGLDIGTGKIKPDEMQNIPHHLLSFLEVNQTYDANQFKIDAHKSILEINARKKLPIIVGGTGLYLEGLLYDLEYGGKASRSQSVRTRLGERLNEIGEFALWDELNQIDPTAAANIPYQNSQRVIRALEVIEVTGDLFSQQQSHQKQESVYQELIFILNRPRSELYDRINLRVDKMIDEGLEQEVYRLYQLVDGEKVASTKGIGYKEWWPYFENQMSIEDVVEQIKQHSRRYAKRQLTWFRNRLTHTHWLDNQDEALAINEAITMVTQYLSNIEKGKMND